MQATLMNQGVTLMLVGMGTVFVFLTLLVAMMSVMAQVVQRLTPAAEEGVSDEEVAAISAAITQHRNKQS
ncbi:MAG: sodium pump decarboxylase subunit gamma [Gammaproteobacteria bacterium]|nr:sodium pump decarboxylase subunit gamma [Gammaproteobacteria bacterium]